MNVYRDMLMKYFLVAMMIATGSCSVVRDHPKTVPVNSSGDYMIQLRIKNEPGLTEAVRTTCITVPVYIEWDVEKETSGATFVKIKFRNMAAVDCNRLLSMLDEIRGVKVLEAMPSIEL